MEQISFKEFCEKYFYIEDKQGNHYPFHSKQMDKIIKMGEMMDEGYEFKLIHKRRGGTEVVAYKTKH